MPDDVFLASPKHKAPSNRRSSASLRAGSSTLGGSGGDDDAGANGRFSLAHELAVAMMPEPSAGSKLLAEEFGIEFDEGAEGIDERPQIHVQDGDQPAEDGEDDTVRLAPVQPPDFGVDPTFGGDPSFGGDPTFGGDPAFGSPPRARAPPKQDAMEVLAQDLESTDNFLSHLRRLDTDSSASSSAPPAFPSSPSAPSGSGSSSQPELERLASDVIRRINDTARDRESQVRELLEYEREFRRIGGEVGGQDVLGRLDALPEVEADADADAPTTTVQQSIPDSPTVSPVVRPQHLRAFSQDWETDPDVDRLGDTTDPAYDDEPSASPSAAQPTFASPSFSPAIPPALPAAQPSSSSTARGAPAQLAALRAQTTSLVASLTALSEHAQVNGAATADAGRKLRALRNRLGGWRAEWEGAERSRGRIERWEAGEGWASATGSGTSTPAGTPVRGQELASGHTKRVDGRKVVQEHLHAFELALAEAAVKTQAIMAAS
ncbi:hypothetical protein DFH08DRAFT_926996 [Mycena albidolilacea]|uniref:Uncharacterized protein n=1 Tax=Mycena albidolilacea TaxID=1033008 RepID=A0AAD6ZA56_9AGAR|nr:hypothetical protein DFH08DRAFT_926996 [Mycena albidolilacea]